MWTLQVVAAKLKRERKRRVPDICLAVC